VDECKPLGVGGGGGAGVGGGGKLLTRDAGGVGPSSGMGRMPAPPSSDEDGDEGVGGRGGNARATLGIAATMGRAALSAAAASGKRAIERVMSSAEAGVSADEAQELLYELFDSSSASTAAAAPAAPAPAAADDPKPNAGAAAAADDQLFASTRLPDGRCLAADISGRGLHSSTFQLNLSRF